ncbi:hypothetical protein IT570_03275 [Candidatus Sumerlaeota bacterium]|nr:hypothetical protein [Candidatus Sumerlaeota bacterium]
MISARTDALLLTAAIAFLLELLHVPIFGRVRGKAPRRPRPVIALALLLGTIGMQLVGAPNYAPLEPGSPWALPMVVAGAVALMVFTLRTDVQLPSSRRHFIGTIAGATLLYAGGLRIPFFAIPGMGVHTLGPVAALLVTVAFVFLFVSMIEICATVPLLASLVSIVIGFMVFVPSAANQSFPGQVLCGSLIGAIAGRLLAQILVGRERIPDKTEILSTGYFTAAATLATFVKSIATAGFILPLGIVTIVFVTLAVVSFERTTILRASPRG